MDQKPPATISLSFPQDEGAGDRIGHYKLLQKLGEGGCGVVFMADQEEPVKRRVALKVIKLGMDTRQVVARFEAERQALAMMDHPNIAKALDAGATENGRPYFVMELVRGVKITDYCDQNKLGTSERLKLFTQVCSAIQHAHQKGIIHRDIKPSNILVTMHDGEPVPKVIDFGIAKATQQALTDKTLFTEIQQFIGTPAYMSPEQAELSGLDIDTRSDIYSLGVLLYELLTGRTPFDQKSLVKAGLDEIRRIIREDEPPRPSTRVSTLADAELTEVAMRRHLAAPQLIGVLRGDLDWIVMKCLEKDRTRRYDTANGLALDVKRFLAHEPVSARPPSAGYRIQKFARRHQVGMAAGAAVAVALILGFGFSTWSFIEERKARSRAEKAENEQKTLRGQAESAREKAVEQQKIAEEQKLKAEANELEARRALYAADMNLVQQALKANNLGRARRLLDRHRPTNGAPDLRGWEWRYLWHQCQSDALFTLTNHYTRAMSVAFSHDGALAAVGFIEGRIGIWNLADRRLIQTLQTNGSPAFVAFSPKARILLTSKEGGNMRLLNLDTQEEKELQVSGGNWPTSLAFSRDGTKCAALAGRNESLGRVRVWSVPNGQVIASIDVETRGSLHQGRIDFSTDGEVIFLGGAGCVVEARRISDGAQLWKTQGAEDLGLTSIAASPNGKFIAAGFGFRSNTIRIWTTTGEPVATLSGHKSWVADLDFSPDGKRLLSTAADQTLRIWDAENWKELRVLRGHQDEGHAGVFSPDGKLILSGAKDGNVSVWSATESKIAASEFTFPEGIDSIHLLGDSEALALTQEKSPVLWNLKTRQPRPLELPAEGGYGFEGHNQIFHYDKKQWVTIYVYEKGNLRPAGKVDVGPNLGSSAWWVDSGAVAIGRNTNYFELLNLKSPGQRRIIATEFAGPMLPWRFLDEGRVLAGVVNNSGELSFWNFGTGERLPGFEKIVINTTSALNVGPAREFAFVGFDTTRQPYRPEIFVCDFAKGTTKRQFVSESRNTIVYSPDGKFIASGSDSGKAFLHSPVDGQIIRVLHGHLNSVSGVAFSPDSKRLVTSSGSPEALKIWDPSTGQEILNIEGEGSLLGVVNVSADGNTILAGSRNRIKNWFLWQAPSWEEIQKAEAQGL